LIVLNIEKRTPPAGGSVLTGFGFALLPRLEAIEGLFKFVDSEGDVAGVPRIHHDHTPSWRP
jgi:hypothetical protein